MASPPGVTSSSRPMLARPGGEHNPTRSGHAGRAGWARSLRTEVRARRVPSTSEGAGMPERHGMFERLGRMTAATTAVAVVATGLLAGPAMAAAPLEWPDG